MKIAILGGGHGAYAAAADLSEAGHEVRLWRRDAAALQPVVDAGSIVLKDADGAREVRIAEATADIGEAVRHAELIVIPSPAIAQVDMARALAAHLVDGQVVFLPPGTFGSVVMARVVREAGCRADVAWAETGTLPYLAPCDCRPGCIRRDRPTTRWRSCSAPTRACMPAAMRCRAR